MLEIHIGLIEKFIRENDHPVSWGHADTPFERFRDRDRACVRFWQERNGKDYQAALEKVVDSA